MGGFCLNYCAAKAKSYISPMFVDVCFNFTPFLSQCTSFMLDAQGMPGIWTTYGGAILFIGCTLLSMNYQDQKELAKVPLIGRPEIDDPVELVTTSDEINPNK